MSMTKLDEILDFYLQTYAVDDDIEEVKKELIENNVEVCGDSFYCEIVDKDTGITCLLAGTKDRADSWVLKKIIKLLRSDKPIVTMLNGNSDTILPMLSKYNAKVINKLDNGIVYISFNM